MERAARIAVRTTTTMKWVTRGMLVFRTDGDWYTSSLTFVQSNRVPRLADYQVRNVHAT